jgi:serine/threonine protein kinase
MPHPITSRQNSSLHPPRGGSWLRRNLAAPSALELVQTAVGRRYCVEGAPFPQREHVAYSGTRRWDDSPVWILVPQWPHAERFPNASGLVRATKSSMRLQHPNVVRAYEVGLLADGRPYVVAARVPARSLDAVLAQGGPLPWPVVRGIALRLCSALEALRRRGLAPRTLDLESCILVDPPRRDVQVAGDDVRVGGLFVPANARPIEGDAPAIAMIAHALLGADPAPAAPRPGVDNVLLRALGMCGYADTRELSRAIAAIEDDGWRESHGANHAETVGEFVFDAEDARAEPRERALSPHSDGGDHARLDLPTWHDP